MPPATTTEASPTRISRRANITAWRPEPHTLLSVMAPALTGIPALIRAWRAGACRTPRVDQRVPRRPCSPPRRQHVAHVDVFHLTGIGARALHRFGDRDRAEVGGGERTERPLKRSDRSARCAADQDLVFLHLRILLSGV